MRRLLVLLLLFPALAGAQAMMSGSATLGGGATLGTAAAGGGAGTWTFVQGAKAHAASATLNVTAGDLLFFFVLDHDNALGQTVDDGGKGFTWNALSAAIAFGGGTRTRAFWAVATSGGSVTVTVANGNDPYVMMGQWHPSTAVVALDATQTVWNANQAVGGSATVNLTTNTAGDLILSTFGDYYNNMYGTQPAGYTADANLQDATGYSGVVYKLDGGAAAPNSLTWGGLYSGTNSSVVLTAIAFKATS